MDDQAAQEEIQHLRQEIQDIDAELARLRTERRLFGRSSFSPEWLILRQRSLHTDRERCQSRLRELARAGHTLPRGPRSTGSRAAPILKVTVYFFSAIALVLVVAAIYLTVGQTRAAAPAVTIVPTPIAAPTATPIPQPTATPTPSVVIYKVAPGDSVSKIAQQYGVTIEDIVKANKLADPRILQVGQELIIPPASATAPKPAPAAPKP